MQMLNRVMHGRRSSNRKPSVKLGLERLEERFVLSPLIVTNTSNSAATAGSMPAELNLANGSSGSTIEFNIPTTDPGYNASTQTFTIALTTALPAITAGVTINGATESSFLGHTAFVEIEDNTTPGIADGLNLMSGSGTSIFGLEIVGFTGAGILVQTADNVIGGAGASANIIGSNGGAGVAISGASATGNIVSGNYIGTSPTNPTSQEGNAVGVAITDASNNTIGGMSSNLANIIGFNTASGMTGAGVSISGASSTGNLIAGNDIGTNGAGIVMPNDAGVVVTDSSGNTIGGSASGAGNTIAFNTGDAVGVIAGTGNAILQNPIFGNGSGIVLSSGGNESQASPVIVGVTSVATGANTANVTITVDLEASGFTAGSIYSLDFFASAPGDPTSGVQAHIYLGTDTFTGGTTGTVTFTSLSTPLSTSQTVTATATLRDGNDVH